MAGYAVAALRWVGATIDRHWFAPAPLRDLAIVRIAAFGSQTLIFLWFPDGRFRPISYQLRQTTATVSLYEPLPLLEIALSAPGLPADTPPGAMLLLALFAVAVVAGVLATIGLLSRIAMPVAAAANALIVAHHYSYSEYHHAEALMIIALGVLSLGPSAAVLSVDAILRRRHGVPEPAPTSIFARWPLRLMQWVIALTYFSAAKAKLGIGGLTWFNGHTMTYHYLAVALMTEREAPAFMAMLPPAAHIVPSMIAWLVEATFFVAILVPRAAWIVLLGAAGLHLVVYATMGIAFFQTILLYVVFIESLRLYAPRIVRVRQPAPEKDSPAAVRAIARTAAAARDPLR